MVLFVARNPFDIDKFSFVKKYNLWLVEDNCDSLGSPFNAIFFGNNLGIFDNSPVCDGPDRIIRWTGTWGYQTQSFYPPSPTTGEGGSVNVVITKAGCYYESLRDWGRDCWCPSGVDNTCNKRFCGLLVNFLCYDHKYTYSHLGFN